MSIKGNSVGNPFPNPQNGLSMQGAINMNGQPIGGLNMPTANDQAANKGYVDANKVDKSNVVNNFTTTAEGFVADARALKTLNDSKLSMELRWKNASPNSSFAAQTISVDLSDGEMCCIVFNGNTQDTNMKVHYAPIGYMTWLHSEWNTRCVREGIVRTNSIDFGVGKAGDIDAFVEENNVVCVPVEIYVVKGVSV